MFYYKINDENFKLVLLYKLITIKILVITDHENFTWIDNTYSP